MSPHRPTSDDPLVAWKQRGFADGSVKNRKPRIPLRDDDGAATRAYLAGFNSAILQRERERRSANSL